MLSVFLICLIALLIDHLLGEPKHFHPLIGLGHLASFCEKKLNQSDHTKIQSRLAGLIGVMITLCLPLGIVFLVSYVLSWLGSSYSVLMEIVMLYLCIGRQSLIEHALAIFKPLNENPPQIEEARKAVGRIVSRDTDEMAVQSITNASIESVLENGMDSLFSCLFWFWLAGIEGAICYRIINTLDAMWGYKTDRFLQFGYAAAKLDDAMNYIPARLTALSYALAGNTKNAFACWNQQANQCASPNGGPVMTAGAGALNICIEGYVSYHGKNLLKPVMGKGLPPNSQAIKRALTLLDKALLIWLVGYLLLTGISYVI